ncbi:DNA repair protein XRCC1-like [Ornithodoros turicata]|uniref:DNA repair protein XRCC1-like n=1 Tax=Ornithodoros turicata TaxID=34597 RepID=UPI003139EE17
MPPIKVQHVVSFSSEDQVHKAENLLRSETYRKWKCANPGEKQASIILQFEKASTINSIDIGNESSAFVEVLVARSSDGESDFKVLLVASSFMSPMESRQGSNLNRVRMFGPEKLSQPVAKEKWDRAKIVCTQPFNKSLQYGLTFITFHSPEEPKPVTPAQETTPRMKIGGKFLLKDEEEEEDPLPVGSWFAKQKTLKTGDTSTSPAAIRNASYASTTLSKAEERTPKLVEKAKHNISSSPTQLQAAKVASPSQQRQQTQKQERNNTEDTVKKPPANSSRPTKPLRPFGALMKGVRFVLSGFQNPMRSQIRDKAIEMGARYTGDWDNACTHLVCAFLNTPKYAEVKKVNGRIVTKEWVLDSYKKKALQPWRDYMLGTSNRPRTPEPEDEDDISRPSSTRCENAAAPSSVERRKADTGDKDPKRMADTETPSTSTPTKRVKIPDHNTEAEVAVPTPKKAMTSLSDSGSSDYDAATDCDDDMDTDDEIERALQRSRKAAQRKHSKASDTDLPRAREELKDVSHAMNLPELPEVFKGKSFYIFDDIPKDERRDLTRCIVGHDGNLLDHLEESVKFVVTRSDWCDKFDEALCVNEELVFVRPRWIFRCHELEKSVPYQPFVVTCGEA